MHLKPYKVDTNAAHTAIAIATFSVIFTGLVNIGLDELKFRIAKRRERLYPPKDKPPTP